MTKAASRGARGPELGLMVVALLVTFGAWQVLSRAATRLLLRAGEPTIAIAVRPSDGPALTSLAALAIAGRPGGAPSGTGKAADARAADQLAAKALSRTPLDPDALRLLAQAAEMTGDKKRVEKLMEIMGRQTIRDSAANYYLLNLYASRKEYAKALERADALLRVNPEIAKGALPLIETIAVDPAAQPALIALLRDGPPWRGAFLGEIASKLVQPEDFLDVVLALKDGPHPLGESELRAYLDPLVSRGLVDQAYDTWLQLLPANRLSTLQYVYNGDFEYPLTDVPFDWTITPIDGATAGVEEIADRGDHALHVQFDGRRAPFRNVVQLLKLPAGKYRLSGTYKADALSNPRGMTWRVYCAQRPDARPIAQSERVMGTSDGWKTFETSFEVPGDRCNAQWLRLELASRVSVEETASGGIWYDKIKIGKAEADEPPPDTPGTTMPERPGARPERSIRDR